MKNGRLLKTNVLTNCKNSGWRQFRRFKIILEASVGAIPTHRFKNNPCNLENLWYTGRED